MLNATILLAVINEGRNPTGQFPQTIVVFDMYEYVTFQDQQGFVIISVLMIPSLCAQDHIQQPLQV